MNRLTLFTISIIFVNLINCMPDIVKANRLNQSGIEKHGSSLYKQAITLFNKSVLFNKDPHIPLYNQATSQSHLDYNQSNESFQKVLKVKPEFTEALFNNANLLFNWGEKIGDFKNCKLDKTFKMWSLATSRYEQSRRISILNIFINQQAKENIAYIENITKAIKKKCKDQKKNKNKNKTKDKNKDEKDKTKSKEQKEKEKQNKEKKNKEQKKKKKKDKSNNNSKSQKNNKKGEENPPEKNKQSKQKTKTKLTEDEKKTLAAARKRIKKSSKGQTFNQTRV